MQAVTVADASYRTVGENRVPISLVTPLSRAASWGGVKVCTQEILFKDHCPKD